MAFTYAITRRGDEYRLLITETTVGNDDVATIGYDAVNGLSLPLSGRVVRQDCYLTVLGSSLTVDPVLARVTTSGAVIPDVICANDTPARGVSTTGSAPYVATETSATGAVLYHRSYTSNVAADASVVTEYLILAGLEDPE